AKAIELSQERGATPDLGITHLRAAEAMAELHDPMAAARHRHKAQQIFGSAEMPWWDEHSGVREQSMLIPFQKRACRCIWNQAPEGAAMAGMDPGHRDQIDVAIVGGGVAGTYCGWRLQTAQSPRNAVLFEMSDRIGGRLYTRTDAGIPGGVGELGGMR